MVRSSYADFDSAYVDGALHGDGLTSLQFRKAKGEVTGQTEMPAATGANVIQLERRGNVFIFSAAKFGEPFEVAEIKEFLTKHPVSYPIAQVDTFEPPADFETPRGLPMTIIIAPDGSVAKKFTGPVDEAALKDATGLK